MDHTEAIIIEYDPSVVSFMAILKRWAQMDYPFNADEKAQYRSAVWFLEDVQKEQTETVVEMIQKRNPDRQVYVGIEPATTFYQAEEYHQNYLSKRGAGL